MCQKPVPRLSIIIPTYNCEAFLEDSLHSVLNQLPGDHELILVDDGSSDGTVQKLEQYRDKQANLIVCLRQHTGVSGARNAGLDLAKGDYVTFMDCDDCLQDDFLINSRKLLDEKAGLYIFGIEREKLDGSTQISALPDKRYENVSDFADEYIRVRKLLIYSNCNKFYRRSIIGETELRFAEGMDYGEDRIFNFQYLESLDGAVHGNVITSSIMMLRYIQRNAESLSTKYVPHFFRRSMFLHNAKVQCFLKLSQRTGEDERLEFEASDLVQVIRATAEQCADYPKGKAENQSAIEEVFCKKAILVNRDHSLPEGYAEGLSLAPVFTVDNIPVMMEQEAADAFLQLQNHLTGQGICIDAFSGYRTATHQQELWDERARDNGLDFARRYVAKPGCSEHETGLALDITLFDSNGQIVHDNDTGEYNRVFPLLHKYGFILRYPEGKEAITGFAFEPWHIRFVGIESAKLIYCKGWTLEEYWQQLHSSLLNFDQIIDHVQNDRSNPERRSDPEGTGTDHMCPSR